MQVLRPKRIEYPAVKFTGDNGKEISDFIESTGYDVGVLWFPAERVIEVYDRAAQDWRTLSPDDWLAHEADRFFIVSAPEMEDGFYEVCSLSPPLLNAK